MLDVANYVVEDTYLYCMGQTVKLLKRPGVWSANHFAKLKKGHRIRFGETLLVAYGLVIQNKTFCEALKETEHEY